MSCQNLEQKVMSSDGIHMLAGRVFLPEGTPKGYLHIVHGMTEHIQRYENTMAFFASQGYICFGYDNLGHGYTAKDDSELGFIAHQDGWKYLCRDIAVFRSAMEEEYGKLPFYLLGHSMGSFIVRNAVLQDVHPDKLIVMGTGGPNPAGGIGLLLVKMIKGIYGEKHISPFLNKMAFGSYNKKFRSENDPVAWLTKDKAVRETYLQDKFCTFSFTVSAMQDLMELLNRCNSSSWFASVDERMPILLVSGEEDPVGEYGVGVRKVFEHLKENCKAVAMKLYPECRHEILNDSCRETVLADLDEFLKS